MAGTGIVKVTKYIQSVDNLLNDRGQSTPLVIFDDSFVFSVLDNETYLSYDVENNEWYFDIGGCLPNILSGLIDVSFTNLTDKNFLVYDGTDGLWKNDSTIIDNLQTQITTNETNIDNINNVLIDVDTHLTTHDTEISDLQAAVSSATVPVGGIMLWSGSVVPDGWLLCDGTNGTPNLIDRFVIGGTLAEVNQSGGAVSPKDKTYSYGSVTIYETNLPPHTHKIPSFTTKGAGSHGHSFNQANRSIDPGKSEVSQPADYASSGNHYNTNVVGDHTHWVDSFYTEGGAGISHPLAIYSEANSKKYYVLAYIMFAP